MKSLLLTCEHWLSQLARLFFGLSAWIALPLLVALVGWDVGRRYLFDSPLAWSHELSALLLLLFFFGTLPAAIQQREFIRVNLLLDRAPKLLRKISHSLTTLAALLFAVLVCWRFWFLSLEMREFQDRALYIDLPYWPFAAYVCGLSGLLAVALVLQFFTDWFRD